MKKIYKLLILIQFVICISLILLIFKIDTSSGFVDFPKNVSWIPLTCWNIFLFGLIYELCIGRKPIIRLVYLIISVLLSLLMLVTSFSLTNACLIISGIPYLIMLMVVLIRNTPTTSSKLITNKILPDGIFDKKEINAQYITYGFIALVAFVLIIIFNILNINGWYAALLIPPAVIVVLFVGVKCSRLRAILNKVNNDLDFLEFNKMIDETLSNNISPETYNYLLILKINYLFSYNVKQGIELFSNVKVPINKRYISFYDIVEFEYYIHKKEYDLAFKKLQMIKEPHKSSLSYFYSVFATNDIINNIEAIYSTNQKIRFNNVTSSFVKMYYYETRGNHDLAINNAKDVLEYKSDLKYYNSLAQKVINNENINI